MSQSRIDQAITRIESALTRIDSARMAAAERTDGGTDQASSERVMALVNSHEKLREEVADTLNELDQIIAELEE